VVVNPDNLADDAVSGESESSPAQGALPSAGEAAAIEAPATEASGTSGTKTSGTEVAVVPSPLDALDALGALDPDHVSLLAPQGPQGPDEPDFHDSDEPFQTIFRQAVLDEIRDHAESAAQVEVCGVLVGSVYENSTGAFAYVEGSIRGTYAAGRSAQVTFTAETWQHIDREMDDKFPGRKIVGWYHTHPGFGIFLSEMDLFIQRHFFNARWQGAFVYDPQSKERGLFGWSGGEIIRQSFVVDSEKGSAVTESAGPNISPRAHAVDDAPAGGAPGNAAELTARIKLLEQRQRYMLVGMAALMLVAVVWPLVVLVVMSSSDTPGPNTLSPTADVGQPNAADRPQGEPPRDADPAAVKLH
jgi:proteasome lid subunit RPN8/RPN11